MKKISTGLCLTAMLLGLASCSNEDNPWGADSGEGTIQLSLQTDSRVISDTRADDTRVTIVPDPSEFAITLNRTDGTYSKTWNNTDAFNREGRFGIGAYTLSAEYGAESREGFDAPWYKGETELNVRAGETSHAIVTARLANTMVSVRYTDEFKSKFSAYSAALHSETGDDFVVFAQLEDRPAYMKAEKIDLRLTLTNDQNKQVSVEPYSFTAKPQRHYIVTMGVDYANERGEMRLAVDITEEVESEFVDITLGDELFNAPAPTVTARDFTSGESYDGFECVSIPGDPRVEVMALAGLKEVNFRVVSSNYTPSFGKEVQLVNADALTQASVAASGLEADGFFRAPDKMGLIRLKSFIEKLPVGKHKMIVEAKDKRTVVTETPVDITVDVKEIKVSLSTEDNASYMGEQIKVVAAANTPDVKDRISFKVLSEGEWIDAPVTSSKQRKATRADETYSFEYTLQVKAIEHSTLEVAAFVGSQVVRSKTTVNVDFPKYNIEVDAFAHRAWLKVVPEKSSDLAMIVKHLKVKLGDSEITGISRNESTGIIAIPNLAAAKDYTGTAHLSYINNPGIAIPAFTTETAADVPNGGFDITSQTIRIDKINAGGQWKYGLGTRQNTSSISVYEPNSWASINAKTCYLGSTPMNTWFCVPSTLCSDGKVVIRSVAYDHAGTMPALDNHGVNVVAAYSRNAPASFANRAAGELFLGSYSYDGSEHRSNGISFTSRPCMLKFDYTYAPIEGETAEVEIVVYDESGNVISSTNADINSGTMTKTVMLPEYEFGKKAAKLYVRFISAKGTNVKAPVPSNFQDVTSVVQTENQTISTNAYKSLCVGSVLTIDNVSLGYDRSAAMQAPARKKAKR